MIAMRSFLAGAVILLIFAGGCKKDEGGTGPGGGGGGVVTVNGFVKDAYLNPVSGALVIVTGKTPVSSGTNGAFSIADVTTPYDITVVLGTVKRAVVYQGLTRTDPVLFPIGVPTPTAKTATITGNVPGAASAITKVMFISGTKRWSTTANATTGAYTINASWYDTALTYGGALHVVRWTPNSGFPTNYDGYGTKNLTIVNGGTISSGTSFTAGELSDPSDQSIGGTVVRPAGITNADSKTLYVAFGNTYQTIAGESGTLADPFSYTVASIAGATFSLYIDASENGRYTSYWKTGLTGPATGITVTLEAPPQLSSPVNNATNIDTSISFLWNQGGGAGVNYVVISGASANPRFYIFTTGSTVRIPNLAAQGLGLPSNVSYTWYVERYYPATMDGVASDAVVSLLNYVGGDIGWLDSEGWTFTTKP